VNGHQSGARHVSAWLSSRSTVPPNWITKSFIV
jgi:hypothetical protein